MIITSAKYQKDIFNSSINDSIIAVIDGVTVTVPLTVGNRHYDAIQKWVAEGNTIEEAD